MWTRFSWLASVSVLVLVVVGAAQQLIFGGTAASRSGVLLLIEVPVLVGSWALSRYAIAYGRRLAFREKYLSGMPVVGSSKQPTLGRAIAIQMILCVALLGVAVAQLVVLPVPGRPGTPPLGEPVALTPVATASEARPAASDTPRFIPERIELPGDASAAIVPVATVGRELVVPADPGRVGWWDGSSYVGDPYGSTVIAGHVDVFDRGIGFFYQLWNIKVGERVVLRAGHLRQAYKITDATPGAAYRPGRRQGDLRHRRTAPAGVDHLRRQLPGRPRRVQPQSHRGRPPGLVRSPLQHGRSYLVQSFVRCL